MSEIKIKSIDEAVRNYIISTVEGAYKTKRYWMKEGFTESSAIEKAVKYASGQLTSGVDPEKIDEYILAFRELAQVSNALAEMLAEGKKEIPS